MNKHTEHHNKNKEGISIEIEKYIKQSVDFVMDYFQKNNVIINSVLDIGCDYGYALKCFKDRKISTTGIDPYSEINPYNLTIIKEDFLQYNKKIDYNLTFLNHTLEHFDNPNAVLDKLRSKYIFIAVPDAHYEWASWKTHKSVWTMQFLKKSMTDRNFKALELTYRCFREDDVLEKIKLKYGEFLRKNIGHKL